MSALQELQALLSANTSEAVCRIPARWNFFGYRTQPLDGEIQVNPCTFFGAAIEHLQSMGAPPAFDARSRVLYTLLPRFHTAYKHHGALESGTLLKTVALLPLLGNLGVNTLCLLPIFVPGERYRKGTLGSPYAIRDFFRIDPALHDPLLGACSDETLELAFAALVEGAHRLGMQVMLDIVLRTAARDHVWTASHPEWFYWIRAGEPLSPPYVGALPPGTQVTPERAHLLYTAPDSPAYLSCFSHDPKTLDAQRFVKLDPGLENIERAFGLTTAPAFCDVINDPQPLWTDITYFRLDMGQSEIARAHLPPEHPPALLHDSIKLNLFDAQSPNEELYAQLASVLRAWQSRSIDGVRLDMGHALPRELLTHIVSQAREENPSFFLWSEVFNPEDAAGAEQDGFNIVTGQLWDQIWSLRTPFFHKHVLDPLLGRPLPSLAALEMPDTPRATLRVDDKQMLANLWRFVVLLPNVVPLINDGQELMERQPLNLGLGNTEQGRFALDPADEAYGLLAFFDHTALHWNTHASMEKELGEALALRKQFIPLLADKAHFRMTPRAHKHRCLSAFAYTDGKRLLLVMYMRCGKRTRFSLHAYFDQRLLSQCAGILQWEPEARPLAELPRTCTLGEGELFVLSAELCN